MDEAEEKTRRSWRRASLYRDGLLVMFAALCPLRPGAFSEMQIGENVIIVGDHVRIRLAPVEGKKRRIEDVPLTQDLARRIIRYVSFFRPMFPAPAAVHTHALWLSRNGNPLSRDNISKRFKERLGRRTKKRFTAHMPRHACATFIAEATPEQARMIAGVLGHSGFRTAQRHYIKGQQKLAVLKYQEAVRAVKKRARPKAQPYQKHGSNT